MDNDAVFYNEYAPFPAQWLRELCAVGAIPDGIVDGRPVQEISAADVAGFDICHFFAGIGCWGYVLDHAGWPRSRLRTWSASLPCQPFSQSGKRRGFADSRHLWPAFFQLVQIGRPSVIFGEQVAGPDGLAWLDAVFDDLEAAGYAVAAADLSAAGFGAPQKRQRLYWFAARMADTAHIVSELQRGGRNESVRWQEPSRDRGASHPAGETASFWGDALWIECADGVSRPVGPGLRTLANWSAGNLEPLRGYGNALNTETAIGFVVSAREVLEGCSHSGSFE